MASKTLAEVRSSAQSKSSHSKNLTTPKKPNIQNNPAVFTRHDLEQILDVKYGLDSVVTLLDSHSEQQDAHGAETARAVLKPIAEKLAGIVEHLENRRDIAISAGHIRSGGGR